MLLSKETQRESRILWGFRVLQSKETKRESRILRGFVCAREKRRSVNHVFYEVLCAAE